MTEKFYDPLVAGTLPVYRGAPNVADFAPAPHSYIDVNDFSGPAELAEYLNFLAGNEAAYNEFFQWRATGISPAFRAMLETSKRNPLCRLCDLLVQRRTKHQPQRTNGRHYRRPLRMRQWTLSGIGQRLRRPPQVRGTWTARGPGSV